MKAPGAVQPHRYLAPIKHVLGLSGFGAVAMKFPNVTQLIERGLRFITLAAASRRGTNHAE